jgi:pyocin large subunit-like protein
MLESVPIRVRLVCLVLALLTLSGGIACRVGATAASAAPSDQERERYARATWAPRQLTAHFDKHGREGPYRTAQEYDAAARETIKVGTYFTYVDRESDAERIGFYDTGGNRFTGLTRDGNRITTHFRPDRGEAYVRGLERSSYP